MRVNGNEYTTARGAAPRQVLLVDADAERARQLASRLESFGARVTWAASAHEALRLPLPELIVAAVGLPDGDGLELAAELRRRGGDIVSVLYTERPTYDDCRRAWRLGAADLLRTPIDASEFAQAFERASAAAPRPADAATDARRWTVDAGSADPILRELVALGVRAGFGPAARARLAGAVAEALDNARRHGYAAGAGAIAVDATRVGDRLRIVVSDGGCGFDVLRGELDAVGPLLPGGGTAPGGLARLRALADDLRIESEPGAGTRVTLCIDPHPAAFGDEAPLALDDRDWLDPDQARRLLAEVREPAGDVPAELPPALAVALGRLLAATDSSRLAQRALWS